MHKSIILLVLLMTSRFLIVSDGLVLQSGIRVRFSSDVTVSEPHSPILTRHSSESDASHSSSIPKTPISLKEMSVAEPKSDVVGNFYRRRHVPVLTPDQIEAEVAAHGKCLQDLPAQLNPLTGLLESPLSEDQIRDMKHQVGKDTLAKKAPLYKRILVFLGCTPHLKPRK